MSKFCQVIKIIKKGHVIAYYMCFFVLSAPTYLAICLYILKTVKINENQEFLRFEHFIKVKGWIFACGTLLGSAKQPQDSNKTLCRISKNFISDSSLCKIPIVVYHLKIGNFWTELKMPTSYIVFQVY